MTAAAGAVLVLSAAILALRRYYARQRRCRDLLWSFAAALGEMESAIRWQRTPVLPLLEVLQTREHCGVWFCQIRDKVQSDMTLQLAWENTFHQLSDAELRDLLCRISWSGDAQRLESTIARARAEAEQLYEKRREADRHSRRVTTTATLCGAGLMIIYFCEGQTMDVDLIFKIAAIGILVAVLNLLLVRSGREEQAMMTTLAGLIVVLMMLVQQISDLFDLVKTLFSL